MQLKKLQHYFTRELTFLLQSLKKCTWVLEKVTGFPFFLQFWSNIGLYLGLDMLQEWLLIYLLS